MKHVIKKTSLLALVCALMIAFVGCDKDDDPIPGSIIHENITITEPTVWLVENNPHTIRGTVVVSGTTLTLEPGTILRFEADAKLEIRNDNAAIIAVGLPDKGIVFTSAAVAPKAGDWEHVGIINTSLESQFAFCIFEFGGKNANRGMLVLDDARASVIHSVFRHSAGYHVFTNSSKNSAFSMFANNELSGSAKAAILISPNHAHTLGEGNLIDAPMGIEVDGTSYTNSDETWKAQTVPYVLGRDLSIVGANNPVLRLAPGVTLAMRTGVDIKVSASNNYGTLIAQGTEEHPVTFTSFAATPQPGDWGSLWFQQGATNCLLEYAIINYGGANTNIAMVELNHNAHVSIRNCHISHGKGREFRVSSHSGNGFAEFTNNIIESVVGEAMIIRGQVLHTLGEGNTFIVPENSGIRVSGFTSNTINLSQDARWSAQNVPYIIEDYIRIYENATLTLDPGTELKFINGKHIEVGYNSTHGRLIAQGTEDLPIVFTSASAVPQKGDWQGIRFSRFALSGSILEHCNIGYAGPNATYKANVIVDPSGAGNPVIRNCEIHNSNRHGIYKNKFQGNWGEPLLENNIFHNNTMGDVGEDN
ncbi:MAG: hypothetical protein EA361_04440 [Bacteroidetes bacterium]|nr:MAG: hypothetical protein EA361_04440 [Bacteroidota bacterium]